MELVYTWFITWMPLFLVYKPGKPALLKALEPTNSFFRRWLIYSCIRIQNLFWCFDWLTPFLPTAPL